MTQKEILDACNIRWAAINERMTKLAAGDYIDNKITEAMVEGGMEAAQAMAAQYTDTLQERQQMRSEINQLEAEIEELQAIEPEEDDPSRTMEG